MNIAVLFRYVTPQTWPLFKGGFYLNVGRKKMFFLRLRYYYYQLLTEMPLDSDCIGAAALIWGAALINLLETELVLREQQKLLRRLNLYLKSDSNEL